MYHRMTALVAGGELCRWLSEVCPQTLDTAKRVGVVDARLHCRLTRSPHPLVPVPQLYATCTPGTALAVTVPADAFVRKSMGITNIIFASGSVPQAVVVLAANARVTALVCRQRRRCDQRTATTPPTWTPSRSTRVGATEVCCSTSMRWRLARSKRRRAVQAQTATAVGLSMWPAW